MNGILDFIIWSLTCMVIAICFWFVIDMMETVLYIMKEKLGIGNDEDQ